MQAPDNYGYVPPKPPPAQTPEEMLRNGPVQPQYVYYPPPTSLPVTGAPVAVPPPPTYYQEEPQYRPQENEAPRSGNPPNPGGPAPRFGTVDPYLRPVALWNPWSRRDNPVWRNVNPERGTYQPGYGTTYYEPGRGTYEPGPGFTWQGMPQDDPRFYGPQQPGGPPPAPGAWTPAPRPDSVQPGRPWSGQPENPPPDSLVGPPRQPPLHWANQPPDFTGPPAPRTPTWQTPWRTPNPPQPRPTLELPPPVTPTPQGAAVGAPLAQPKPPATTAPPVAAPAYRGGGGGGGGGAPASTAEALGLPQAWGDWFSQTNVVASNKPRPTIARCNLSGRGALAAG
jgi:hypothetical protein